MGLRRLGLKLCEIAQVDKVKLSMTIREELFVYPCVTFLTSNRDPEST